MVDSITHLWGKFDSETNLAHPLAYHMLDVAAVAAIWLEKDSRLSKLFLKTSEFSQKDISTLIPIACALHDIGKASVYFQNKIPQLAEQKGLFYQNAAKATGFDHGSFGCIWIDQWRSEEKEYLCWTKNYQFMQYDSFIKLWKAACWHHGKTIYPLDYDSLEKKDNKPRGKGDIFDIIVKFRNETLYFVVKSILDQSDFKLSASIKITPSFIRLFAGFVSICDWIGSDKKFFSYKDSFIQEYWIIAKQSAEKALNEINLLGVDSILRITSFEKILDPENTPRPIQKALEDIQINQPSLVIIEAPTGEGKTESALFQFARNPGRGLYFGLPTQASANQIWGRVELFLKNRMQTNENAILAHGTAWLVKALSQSKDYDNNDNSSEITAESEFSDWFNSKKRTLLTRFGVGTVDQAMLSALNVKHGFVKLFGLAGKTLIIDEVHAYDSFMLPIIEHLIRWCGYLETSIVLLSATLPSKMKERLVSAYLDIEEIKLANKSYPLLTVATKSKKTYFEIDSYRTEKIQTRKTETINFRFLSHDPLIFEEVIAKALSLNQDGGNILWICNTVKKAQMVYEAILGKMETDKIINLDVHLFHSRFTKIDRLTNEKKIESLYGDEKKSPDRPLKSILIATQVAEQSLDIDFDFLITDIAPVDLILQRAGRMFRHDRTNRNVNFRAPEIILLIPNDLSKLRDFASVYDKFTVLKTMHILSALNGYAIQLPFMYRTLVDTVYSDSIPESEIIDFKGFALGISKSKWEEFLLKKKKDMEELDAKGRRGLIPLPSNEYPADSALLSEEESSYWSAKTRDGEEKIGLIMIKEKNGILTIGESYLKTDLPDKIPRELAVSLAENTVEIGIKGFVIRAKKEKSLVGSNSILNKWQAKIDKVPQFKGNKFMLLNENNQANLSFSNAEFMLEYDSIMGLKIQKIK